MGAIVDTILSGDGDVLKYAGGYIQSHERQIRLYGHVARLPTEDPTHRILSCRDPSGWTTPRGRSHASCLRQMEIYLNDTGVAGLVSAWAMARRRPRDYRRKVDAATRCSSVCPPYLA